jgi:hypothetical protein
MPSGSLNAGESSIAMPLTFSNADRQRFGFDITILGAGNAAPFFSSALGTQATEGVEYTSLVEVTDPDGHDVNVEILTGCTGLSIAALGAQPSVVSLLWTPGATQNGLHEVVLRATEGHGGSAVQTFTLDVQEALPKRPSIFQTALPTQINSGTSFSYTPGTFDLDGDTEATGEERQGHVPPEGFQTDAKLAAKETGDTPAAPTKTTGKGVGSP